MNFLVMTNRYKNSVRFRVILDNNICTYCKIRVILHDIEIHMSVQETTQGMHERWSHLLWEPHLFNKQNLKTKLT